MQNKFLQTVISSHLRSVLDATKEKSQERYVALSKQFIASDEEHTVSKDELAFPQGSEVHAVTERFIHQYKNRGLLLSTDRCISYCRYCFRRDFIANPEQFIGTYTGFIKDSEIDEICAYLAKHEEIEEVLISGGDVMTGTQKQIFNVLDKLRSVRKDLLLRFCTRANVFAPTLFTPTLIQKLRSVRPLWIVPHINHPEELCKATVESFNNLIDAGIPIFSQSVLLKGVNDNVEILKELFNKIVKIGIKPGYLFQADIVKGTSHFRVPAPEAIRLYEDLKLELSGLSLPVFTVDLPSGGGKLNMLQMDPTLLKQTSKEGENYYEITKNGKTWYYPKN